MGATVQHSASVHVAAAQVIPPGLGLRLLAWAEQSCGSFVVPSALASAHVGGAEQPSRGGVNGEAWEYLQCELVLLLLT